MTILEMSFFSTVLILVVLIIRALAVHKLPKKTFLALWGIVICRLLIPFSIASQFSIYTAINRLEGVLKQGTTSFSGVSMPTTGVTQQPINPSEALNISTGNAPFVIVWLVGMVACMLFFLITHYRCRSEYKAALPIENDYVQKWMAEHMIRRTVKIRQSERITAPLTYGIWHPVVLLPKTMDWTDEEQLQYVLSHEYTHIKRFDIATKWLLAIVVSIHWFNPLVWVMYILANRDLELSCDETVVRSLGEATKSSYAMTLISLEERKSSLTPLCNSFSKNAIEERIVSIMKMKKTSIFGIVLALILVAGVTTAFATSKLSSSNSLIRQSINVTDKIGNHIDGVLKDFNITVESIEPSHDAITEGMDTHWTPYNLMSTDGNKYLLIIRADGKDYTALLDSEGNLLDGLVDNGVLPKYFELHPTTNQPELFRGGDSHDKAIEVNGMLAAIGIDGNEGWVYARELDTYPEPNTPEEALRIQNQNALDYPEGYKYINLYDRDGVTIIGKFKIGNGSANVIYKDASNNEKEHIPNISEVEESIVIDVSAVDKDLLKSHNLSVGANQTITVPISFRLEGYDIVGDNSDPVRLAVPADKRPELDYSKVKNVTYNDLGKVIGYDYEIDGELHQIEVTIGELAFDTEKYNNAKSAANDSIAP